MNYQKAETIFIIFVTLILFITALFAKGLTHDILLESAIFLVSVKLIIMSHRTNAANKKIENHLKEIKKLLSRK